MTQLDVTNSMQAALMKPALMKPAAAKAGDREKFTDLMRVSFDRQGEATGENEELRNAANQLVSVAFIKPLMAQMRQSPFKNDMFQGGQGETIFQEHLDTVLADRISSRSNFAIADAVYRKIAGQKHNATAPASNASPAPSLGRVNLNG